MPSNTTMPQSILDHSSGTSVAEGCLLDKADGHSVGLFELPADDSVALPLSTQESIENVTDRNTASTSDSPAVASAARQHSLQSDLLQLTKPRIVVMILVTTVATAMIAAGGWVPLTSMILLLLGTGLVAGSAGGGNQIWERVIDCNMPRTAVRPLPSRRMAIALATAFTACIGTLGVAILWNGFGPTPALVGLATWLLYVLVYTPLKTRTSFNTTIGAVAGALPMWIGYTAMGGSLTDTTAWLLLGVLAAWQYPHFMAIAWLYRKQYDKAGFQMSTTVEPTGWSASVQSIVGSLAVIGCGIGLCLIPTGMLAASVTSVAVLAATLPMLIASIRFARNRDDVTARRLLRSSLLVLPAVLAVVTLRVFW